MTRPDPTRRSERARTAILEAARELLSEVGFVRLTVESIASRAGVGKQTIYRWWPSKEAVLFDALLASQAAPDGSQQLPDTGDIVADLRTVLSAVVEELVEPGNDRLLRTITAEIQHDPLLSEELLERLLRPQLDATADRLRAAQRAGQIAMSVDPRLATELLFGPMFHRWLLRTAPLDAAYVDQLVQQVLRGIAR
jgi:AcrR family transcriptional regulator